MKKISRFLKEFSNVIKLIRLGYVDKQVTFYSEGENHWPHLESMISKILNDSGLSVCFDFF